MTEVKLLHIYPQEYWHTEAIVIGNRAGLEAMRNAIDQALEGLYTGVVCVFASDGEGYHFIAHCHEADWQDDFWNTLGLPYQDEVARDKSNNAIWPQQIEAIIKAVRAKIEVDKQKERKNG